MRFVIITKRLMAGTCGIADHTISFVRELCASGEHTVVSIGLDSQVISDSEYIDLESKAFDDIFRELKTLSFDHLILQYTPLMYVKDKTRDGDNVQKFWEKCCQNWKTSIIVHETYFRVWWHPKSWINGFKEKRLLKNMVLLSDCVFSASQPLVDEMKRWSNDAKVTLLPIGSNFELSDISIKDVKQELGISEYEIVLVLFGGGTNLKWLKNLVIATDELLASRGIAAHWLMLGGIPKSWFKLKLPMIYPGRLSSQQISNWLPLHLLYY